MIKNYIKFLTMFLAMCCMNTAFSQISDCQSITPVKWGSGPWLAEGTNYNFVAESANDAILAMGSGDLSIEVFAGSCGGTSLGLYNTVGDGEIERIVVGNLVVGQTYSFTITGGTSVFSKVKTYAAGRLRDNECPGSFNILNKIHALRKYQMYDNLAVNVTGFTYRFEDVATGDVIVAVRNTIDGHSPQLSTIPGLQTGHTYNVQVKHRVMQIANGAVAQLYSDYGSICTISIISGLITDCVVLPPTMWGTGPWTNINQGVFVAKSSNDAILAKGDGDLSVEVFLGECGGTSVGMFSTVGSGTGSAFIERIVVGDLIAGETYSYYVTGGTNIMSKVKTYADGRLRAIECSGAFNLSDQIHALRENELYANPAVQVTGFSYRFEDIITEDVYEEVRNTVDGHTPQLSTIPGLQAGHSYIVQVAHRVLQVANGVVATLWSDYGSECVIAINESEGDFTSPVSSLILSQEELTAVIYPNPNTGDNVNVELKNLVVSDSKLTIEILDFYGKKVFLEQYAITANDMTQKLIINENLASGMYLVNIVSNGQSVVKKMNVQ